MEILQFIIFILIFALIGVFCYYGKAKKTFFLNISFIILLLIIGLRSVEVGTDTPVYLQIYGEILNEPSLYSAVLSRGSEQGYIVLCWIAGKLGLNFQSFLFITGLLILVGPYFLIRALSKDKCLSVFIYITMFYFSSVNTIRRDIALSIVCFFFLLMCKRKYFWAFVTLPIMFLFHKTSLVIALFYVAYFIFRRIDVKLLIGGAVAIGTILLLGIRQLVAVAVKVFGKYEYYLADEYYFISERNLLFMLVILALIVVYIVENKAIFYTLKRPYSNNKFADKFTGKLHRNRPNSTKYAYSTPTELLSDETYHYNRLRPYYKGNNRRKIKRIHQDGKLIDDRVIIDLENKFDYKVAVLALVCVVLIGLTSIIFTLADRMVGYFSIIMIVFVPNITMKNKWVKIMCYAAVIGYCFITVALRPEWTIFPYSVFW